MNSLDMVEIVEKMTADEFEIDEKLLKVYEDINPETRRIAGDLRFISIWLGCHPIVLLFGLMSCLMCVIIDAIFFFYVTGYAFDMCMLCVTLQMMVLGHCFVTWNVIGLMVRLLCCILEHYYSVSPEEVIQ